MRVLSFVAAGELYAADIECVQAVMRRLEPTPVRAADSTIAGIVNIRGKVVTLLDMDALLGRACREQPGAVSDAVVFKDITESGDQMGLLISAACEIVDPGSVQPLPPEAELAGGGIIGGIAEHGSKLYRILDIRAIIARFTS
ncbi:MAG: chemotaxis protein CheW [Oscillospiraceae bacterium]|jgi:purine-binding chemotaxis protein CheW|nr:chemotaxis protein CheW [Oscillospiraceae bacterium]